MNFAIMQEKGNKRAGNLLPSHEIAKGQEKENSLLTLHGEI